MRKFNPTSISAISAISAVGVGICKTAPAGCRQGRQEMGKRSNFERRAADFYPTPRAAVVPLIPYLRGIKTFAEPCAGDGDLVRHLECFGLRCVYSGDIRDGQDALARDDYGGADCIITNPPWSRDVMHRLIAHFQSIAPTWLLLDADWAQLEQAAPYLPHCSDIVAIGRVKWIEGSKHTGKDNCALVQVRHQGTTAGPVFHWREHEHMSTSLFDAPNLRAMPQGLRAAAIQFAVLFAGMQAAAPIARGLA